MQPAIYRPIKTDTRPGDYQRVLFRMSGSNDVMPATYQQVSHSLLVSGGSFRFSSARDWCPLTIGESQEVSDEQRK